MSATDFCGVEVVWSPSPLNMEMLLAIQLSLVLLLVTMNGCVGETDNNIVLNSDIVEQLLTQVNENTDLIKNLVEENNLLKVRMTAIEKHARHDSFTLRKKIQSQERLVNNLLQLVARNSVSSMIHNVETKSSSQNDISAPFNSTQENNTTINTHNLGQVQVNNQQANNESAIKQTTHERIRRQTFLGQNVAFTAEIQAAYLGSKYDPVIFETVVTNTGDAYDATTGVFRAPVAGMYVFATTLSTYSTTHTYYYIHKNEDKISRLYIHGDSQYSSTSSTVTLELVRGDTVSVRDRYSNQQLVGDMTSTFSGFLLHQPLPQGTIS